MLETRFKLAHHRTTVRTEILAGLTTFLTMAYITVVNPAILADAGMDFGAVFVVTCLAAALGSFLMGWLANYPIALAPGMGLNAFFAYAVVQGLGQPWPVALGAVFLAGLLFVLLSILPVRAWIIHSIPGALRVAISAGIGLFLGLIALRSAGVVADHPTTLVALGDLRAPEVWLAGGGFVLMVALDRRRVPGAVLIGILATTAAGVALGVSGWKGLVAPPPDPSPVLLQLDLAAALHPSVWTIIFAFLFVDLFDTAGTLLGLAHHARLLDARGRLPRLGRALLADSTASVVGAALGTSTTTSYVESAAGIKAGGRTGLTAVTVGVLFLLSLFFAPLAATVPGYATAPALLFVACLMAQGLAEVDRNDPTEVAPAVLTALAMPLTFSIADGIGIGFVTYTGAKLASGRWRECPPAVAVIASLFACKIALT